MGQFLKRSGSSGEGDVKRVYVSSTFIDLVAFRAKVLERLRRSKSIVVAMEDYAAFDERPADKCLADVKGCDIIHLGFQEYLAACEMRRLAFEGDKGAVLKDLALSLMPRWGRDNRSTSRDRAVGPRRRFFTETGV